jgi:hypothetical protein
VERFDGGALDADSGAVGLTLDFELTADDGRDFLRHDRYGPGPRAARRFRTILTFFLAVFALPSLVGGVWRLAHGNMAAGLFTVLLGLPVGAATAWGTSIFYRRWMYDESLSKLSGWAGYGPWRITLEPAGVSHSSPLQSGTRPWSEVDSVDVASTGVYLYGGGNQAVVVPRHAFATDADAEAFAAEAGRMIEGAHAAPHRTSAST